MLASGTNAGSCLEGFLQRLDYLAGSLEDAAFYQALGTWIGTGECARNVIFYLSVSPELYAVGNDRAGASRSAGGA